MSAPENSCRRWIKKNWVDGPCKKCFESTCGPCIDYRVSPPAADLPEPQAEVVKAVIEPDGPVRQEINIRAECSKGRPLLESDKDKLRCCTMCVAQEQNLHPNLCSAQCRPLKTYLHLNEVCGNSRIQVPYLNFSFTVDQATPSQAHIQTFCYPGQ